MQNRFKKIIIFQIGFLAVAYLLLPSSTHAQELELNVTNNISVAEDLSALVTTQMIVKNDDPSKITGGYIYSIPFEYSSIQKVSLDGVELEYTELKNEFNQIQIDFKSDTLGYGESATLVVVYNVNQLISQSYEGFYEFYMPKINFDEKVSSFSTNLYLPSFLPSLSLNASNSSIITQSGIQINNNENVYLVWANSYKVAIKQNYSYQSYSKINIPSIEYNNYYLEKSLNATRAYVDSSHNAWAEFDFAGESELIATFTKSNSAHAITNNFDFSTYIDKRSSFSSLSEIYQEYLSLVNEKTLIQSFNDINKESINSIEDTEKVSQLDLCAYIVGISQVAGFKGGIYYGYNTSGLIPTNNPTKPTIWCAIANDSDFYYLDPLLSKQADIVLDPKSNVNKITFGSYSKDNNLLGIIDNTAINIEYVDNFEQIYADVLLSLVIEDDVVAFEAFDAKAYIKNTSALIFQLDTIYLDTNAYRFTENIPIILPFQDNFVDVSNLRIGKPWSSGAKKINVSIEYKSSRIANNSVIINLSPNNELLVTVGLTAFLAIALLTFLYFRIHTNENRNIQPRKS